VTSADNNFVCADWDDDPPYDQHQQVADPKYRRFVKPSSYGPTSGGMKQVDAESHHTRSGLTVAVGVQADPNWLDEDFDDS